jgi:signal transduction histidine kinase
MRNLLMNAVTHTPAGGDIVVRVTRDAARAAIAVGDAGRGIPAEHLALIWERFHRVDPSRDRASGGMGLGLALARELVRAMRGDLSVESTEHVGSTFTVFLPLASPSSSPDT